MYGNSSCELWHCVDYNLELVNFKDIKPIDCSNGGQYCGGKTYKSDYSAAADKYAAEHKCLRPDADRLYMTDGMYSKGWNVLPKSGVIFPAEENERGGQGPTYHMGQYMWGGTATYDGDLGTKNQYHENEKGEMASYYSFIFVHEKALKSQDNPSKCHLEVVEETPKKLVNVTLQRIVF
ncbi:MAG: hypothetical protein IJ660_04940 [Alphaproteobacteria bacterium]|nr:hypothetical protein [Alphaproteobacteria bacterium]